MGYRIDKIVSNKALRTFKEESVNSWREEDNDFLNKKDNIYISKIASKEDIKKMEYEIRRSAIYSNHYDGLVILNISNIMKINDSLALDEFFGFVSEESRYGEYILLIDEEKCPDASKVIDRVEKIMLRVSEEMEI